jgi:hypothetical protein
MQIYLLAQSSVRIYFSRGCKSLTCGVVPEALAGDKVVVGDNNTEGSQTAKVCTDEQVLQG